MKYFLVKLSYTAQVTAQFEITESQLKEALAEDRFGEYKGEAWQKAERLFTDTGVDIAEEIAESTWDSIDVGAMDFTLRHKYRTDEAAESDASEDPCCTELEASEVFINLNRVAWLDDVEIEEHESTY